MFSWYFSGTCLQIAKLLGVLFSNIHSYLNHFGLLITSALVNGCEPNNTIAPLSFIIRLYCAQSGSNGITVSHLRSVVPYGGSVSTKSTEPSGISFISSKQSPLCKSICNPSPHFIHSRKRLMLLSTSTVVSICFMPITCASMAASTGSILLHDFAFPFSLSALISPKLFVTILAFTNDHIKSSFFLSNSTSFCFTSNLISCVASFKNLADCVIAVSGHPKTSRSCRKASALCWSYPIACSLRWYFSISSCNSLTIIL